MPENPNQNKGIKSERDAGELETKGTDRIYAQCQRTQNKRKRSNLGMMLENLEQKEGIESRCNGREPEKKRKGSNLGAMPENPNQNEGIESWCIAREHESK